MAFAAAIAAAAEAAPVVKDKPPITPGLVVHIDGDYLAYFASGNDDTSPGMARLTAAELIQKFKDIIGAESAVVHNTASGCHKGERFLAATVKPYQGQRDGGRKPKNHSYLRDYLIGYSGLDFQSKTWATREADDGMAACAHYATKQGKLVGVATADKDMRMFPGLHIDWRSHKVTEVPNGTFAIVGENGKLYGMKWFWQQMLMGDTADNCPGLEQAWCQVVPTKEPRFQKVGEKTAEKLLLQCVDSDDAGRTVIDLYRRSYRGREKDYKLHDFGDDRFCEQACLMWMRLGPKAEVDDFTDHIGHLFDASMWSAVERLKERIRVAREALNSLGG